MSEHKTAKYLLKDKFLDIEMQIADDSLDYSLSQERISKIATNQSSIILYVRFIGRFAMLGVHRAAMLLTFFTDKILVSGLRKIGHFLDQRWREFTKSRLENEIKLDSYLKKLENSVIVDKDNAVVVAGENDKIALLFESKYLELFSEAECAIEIHASDALRQCSYYTLEFNNTLIKSISESLEKTNMLSNIENMKIHSVLSEKNIKTHLKFELKIMGEKWATIFSKHISSVLVKMVSSENGRVGTVYKFYPKEKKEIVILTIEHDLIFKRRHKPDKMSIDKKGMLANS